MKNSFPTTYQLDTTHKISRIVAEQVTLFLAGEVTRKEVAPILTNMVQWIRFCQVTDKELKDACDA